MKKILLITGLCGLSVAYAEPKPLPPIINHSSYANGVAYSGNAASKPVLEMLARVERLQAEIQELRGLIEQQAHEISNLKKRQQNSYTDIDMRLQQLEAGGSVTSVETETDIVQQTTKISAKAKESTDPSVSDLSTSNDSVSK